MVQNKPESMENFKLAKIADCNGDLSKRWYVHYSYKHPETNKFQRFIIWIPFTLRTKTARLKKASEIVENINVRLKQGFNPFFVDNTRLKSIKDSIDYAMQIKKATCRERGYSSYRDVSNNFLKYLSKINSAELPADSFTLQKARDFLDYLLLIKKVSNRTYNNNLEGMRILFNILIEREIITINPFQKIKKLRLEEPAITAYTEKELKTIRATLPDYYMPLWVISQLIYYCFIRPTEIRRLRVKDFDLKRQFITVHGHQSKNKKQELVVIPDPLLTVLKDYGIEQMKADQYLFSTKLLPGTKMIRPDRISEYWSRYRKTVNITKAIYDFKPTGAGYLFDSGANARDIQLQLRHHSLDQTVIYLNKFRRVPSDAIKTKFPEF